jgi:hypothetical protein
MSCRRAVAMLTTLLVLAACGGGIDGTAAPPKTALPAAPNFKTPIVIAVDLDNHRLVYWPMSKRGSATPRYLSRRLRINATAMVANGDVVTIASSNPSELLSYNVTTGATNTIADTYGLPVDVAIGKTGTLYALNERNVGVFPAGASPYEMSCRDMSVGFAVAVDNEGDVFVNGYGRRNFEGVVEYPAGSSKCSKLPLKVKEEGYPVGLGVDPKTDDLIVEDWVGCAGGDEGRITVYDRPYGLQVVAKHFLHASCPSGFRLDATSSKILVLDSLDGVRADHRVHGCGIAWVDQRSYPEARGHTTYTEGCARAVTTIPNTLPN